ncbi:MFS transporter [bacterium]|nr:MFS transporter [bacterium]
MRVLPVRFQLSVWLAVAAAIAYVCRTSISVAEKTIREDIGLTEEQMGFILGPAFFWSYALAQIPGGAFGQAVGSRRALSSLAFALSAASAFMAVAYDYAILLAGRLLGGIAQAGLFPCSALSISKWYPKTERALASGILGAAMSVGAALGAAVTGELLDLGLPWRSIFVLYAVPGAIWAAGFFAWFRETPAEHPAVDDSERALIERGQDETTVPSREDTSVGSAEQASVPWLAMLGSLTLWMICGQQFFRAAAYAFFTSWFPTYLQETRGVSTGTSGWLSSVPLLATVAASLAGGVVSDWLLRTTNRQWLSRAGLAGVSLAVCAGLVLSAWFVEDATTAALIIGAGALFAGVAGPCAYASTMDFGGQHVAPVFSTMNMIGNFGAGLLPWVVPAFRQWVDASPKLFGLSGGNSWNAVLVLFGVLYFLAAACWLLVGSDRLSDKHVQNSRL